MKEKAYARAGVDIDLGNAVKATLPRLLAATRRSEVLGKVGGFGGLFAFDAGGWAGAEGFFGWSSAVDGD